MINFTAFNPTRLHFGKDVVSELGASASAFGKHALLVYGGGSVKRNDSYSDTVKQLEKQGITITEYDGIRPNPRVEDVRSATELGRGKDVDMVVAVGGGSVIDSAKIIAICIAEGCDAWEVMTAQYRPSSALPLLAVLTLAATGTEMNGTAVLQDSETRKKIGYRNELIYPAHSFLDPAYTLSVPANHTAYGVVDLIAHCLEAWFGEGDASLSDRFVISIIREAFEFGPALMQNPGDYVLRARIMWAATNALNNMTMYGRRSGDWGAHLLGHTLSFLYDTPHGASLSILYPAWIKVMEKRTGERIRFLGRELFDTEDVDLINQAFKEFFAGLGCPVRCQDAGIDRSRKDEILQLMNRNNTGGMHHALSDGEREEILNYVF
ncbi:MAG: iron-containing alcohol dehydrogenase [Bacteroidetes bacterium]|nr:iron-containing alcohol dehydrogenase [Bacteroidota bacterium]